MKTREFGRKCYIVKVYYKDNSGRTRVHTEMYCLKEVARQIANIYTNRKGTIMQDSGFTGEIINVFTFVAKQCSFED